MMELPAGPIPSAPQEGIAIRRGIGWQLQLLVFCVAALAVVSRRPDALFNPQFYAEDGSVWFSEAYASGWLHPLLSPHSGYFQTLPRLAAALALLVPLRLAPLLLNIVGITVQILPINFLLSARCSNWAPLSVRALWAAAYLALPNTAELDATITEGQWHMALLACLVVLAVPPPSLGWRIFDIATLLLSGLTGPFCLILLPLAVVLWLIRREPGRLAAIGALGAPAILQCFALFETAAETRSRASLGATPWLFLQLLGGRVYLGALIGKFSLAAQQIGPVLYAAALLCTAVLLYSLLNAPLELRLFALFCGSVFVASLSNPMASLTAPQWQVLVKTPGAHYWLLPMLAFAWSLIWCFESAHAKSFRNLAAALLCIMCIGVVRDWRYPRYKNLDFPRYAREFAAARPGALLTIPIYPDGWTLRLVKRSPPCEHLPTGVIDFPPKNARIAGRVRVVGWESAPGEHVQRVSVYVDDALARSVVPNISRPDADKVHPESPDKEKGWEAEVDSSGLIPGAHRIVVRALETTGCDAEIDEVPVERVR